MSNFVDQVKITAKAGNGVNGSASFHREKYVQNGGPDGGDGGRGGDILLYADVNMHTLLDFRFHSKYTAENGGDGPGNLKTGKRGADLTIKVPVGTVVRDAETGADVPFGLAAAGPLLRKREWRDLSPGAEPGKREFAKNRVLRLPAAAGPRLVLLQPETVESDILKRLEAEGAGF